MGAGAHRAAIPCCEAGVRPGPWKDGPVNLARWSRRRGWTIAGVLVAIVVLAAAAVFVWPGLMGSSGAENGTNSAETGTSGTDAPAPNPDPKVRPAALKITPMTPSADAPTAA